MLVWGVSVAGGGASRAQSCITTPRDVWMTAVSTLPPLLLRFSRLSHLSLFIPHPPPRLPSPFLPFLYALMASYCLLTPLNPEETGTEAQQEKWAHT